MLFISIVIFTFIFSSFISNLISKKTKIKDAKKNINQTKTNEDNEWIMLNSDAYLKRNALFYLVNKQVIRLFVLSKYNFSITGLNGTILIKTNEMEEKSIYFEKYLIQKYDKNEYNLDFEINSIDINFKYDNLISLQIQLNGINELLNIKIKDINKSNKKFAMICSKPWELSNNAYKTLKFWIKYNQMIGFDKIVIYNNSIENNDNFNNLFEKYNDLIEFHNIKWCLESFFITECFFNNVDLYENIFVIDIDEILVPLKGNKSSTIDYPIQKTDLNNYIDLLKETFKINSQSLHFKMGHYLNDKLIKLIFSKFEMFLISNSKLDFSNQTYEIIVKETDPNNKDYILFDYFNHPFDLIFTVSTSQQYEYLKYLVDQYKNIYEPYFNLNSDFIEKYMPECYARFYFLSGPFVDWRYGKTLHSTKSNPSYLTSHHPKEGEGYIVINRTYAHLSHFRGSYQYYFFHKYKISIDQFYFDYNYFYSYFQKMTKTFDLS